MVEIHSGVLVAQRPTRRFIPRIHPRILQFVDYCFSSGYVISTVIHSFVCRLMHTSFVRVPAARPLLIQTADRKLASSEDGTFASEDIDFKIRHVEHKVKNRDMVLDVIENRLARLEAAEKKKA